MTREDVADGGRRIAAFVPAQARPPAGGVTCADFKSDRIAASPAGAPSLARPRRIPTPCCLEALPTVLTPLHAPSCRLSSASSPLKKAADLGVAVTVESKFTSVGRALCVGMSK